MTFAPIVPFGGLQGWAFLNRTMERQKTAFLQAGAQQRAEAQFRERIGEVRTAGDLVADRQLLSFALDAFGLGDDLNNRAFIRQVLESPTGDQNALAGKLADTRYRAFAQAFGFGDAGGPRTTLAASMDRIVAQWEEKSFETAVGEADADMRIALNAENEIGRIAAAEGTDDGRWYAVLGSAPLRQFVETAFGLPSTFAMIDLDQQVDTLRDRLRSAVGDSEISALADPDKLAKLTRNYFLRSETASAASPQNVALTLLSQSVASGRLSRLI